MLGGIPAPSTPSHLVKKQQSLMQGGTGIREQPKVYQQTFVLFLKTVANTRLSFHF